MPVLHLQLDLTKDLYDRVMAMSEQERELCIVAALSSATAPPIYSKNHVPGSTTPSEPGGTIPERSMAPRTR